MILRGGFPIPVAMSHVGDRAGWFKDFVGMVIERDVMELRKVRQRQVLPRILQHLASRTAGVLQATDIAARVELDNRLVGDYITLLESVFLIHRLSAFGRTLSSRVAKSPKVHMIDTGLAANLLGVTERRLHMRDPATLTEFGHLVETFAVNELIKQGGWSESLLEFSHFRTKEHHEVDLVIESHEGMVAGVEIKAKSSIEDKDFRGLRLLRDHLGKDFVAGVLINLGQLSYTYDDRLWTPTSQIASAH